MSMPEFNRVHTWDALRFLGRLDDQSVDCAFLDPQYRGVLGQMKYGNEGKQRGQKRAALPQMSDSQIGTIIIDLCRVLRPSGYLFLWTDKYQMVQGQIGDQLKSLLVATSFEMVDFLNWYKNFMGMGYRVRSSTEYVYVLQKAPKTTKNWTRHDISDTWIERPDRSAHPHAKPVALQRALIEAVTEPEGVVVDPAAGSGSVLTAAVQCGRRFLGCDLVGRPVPESIDKLL